MRTFWILLALGLAACSPPDFCSDPALTGQSCLTVEVEGQLDPGVSHVDSLQVDVHFYLPNNSAPANDFLDRVTIANTADGGAASGLPVAFPIVLPVGADPSGFIYNSVTVLARFEGVDVGLGHASFRFPGHAHSGMKVSLAPAHSPSHPNDCFDGMEDNGETDVDCGGPDCPACTLGQKCSSQSDCAGTCTAVGCGLVCSGYPEVCGGGSS